MCVSFLYTATAIPSPWGFGKVSRKGMPPLLIGLFYGELNMGVNGV